MGVILEIKAGPMAGRIIGLKNGESVTVGRAAGRAQFALSHDTFMSGVHFAVECGQQGCRVQDRKSSNGTFLNGARIKDAMLANGDEIKGGQTIFSVKIVADAKLDALTPPQDIAASEPLPPQPLKPAPGPVPPAVPLPRAPAVPPPAEQLPAPVQPAHQASPPPPTPPPREAAMLPALQQPFDRSSPHLSGASHRAPQSVSAVSDSVPRKQADHSAARAPQLPRGSGFSVLGWSFPAAPPEWQVQEGFGLQQLGHEAFPGSLAASEESLGGITLQQFVESQISVLRGYLRDPRIEPAMPPRVGGADESMAMDVWHSTKDGRELVYRRIYARSGTSVGVLTVTTLASDLPQVMQSLQPLLDAASFYPDRRD